MVYALDFTSITYCSLIIGLSSQCYCTELYLLVVSTMMLPGALQAVTQDIQQQHLQHRCSPAYRSADL